MQNNLNISYLIFYTFRIKVSYVNLLTTYAGVKGTLLRMNKKTKDFKYYILLIIIFLLGVITRIIAFGEIPIGINVDEAGIMYDAYCIANYGTDRFENNFPVYMINYGGGQSALYTYLSALLIKLFGFSLIVVRTPALIFSILFLIFAFLIAKDFKNKKIAIVIEFIAVIVPWHFMQSRWALDCNLMSAMMLISIYTLCKSKKKIGYIFSGILFGITFYTYALSYIIVPIALILLLAYMLFIKRIKKLDIICLFIPIILIVIPLILNQLVNMKIIPEIKLSWISILKMWEYRANELNFYNILSNFIKMFKTIFMYDINDYNAFPIFGTVYYISIPFAVLGFIESIKNLKKDIREKKFTLDIIMFINFISVFICGIIVEPGINRMNAIYISIIYYISLGIIYVSENRKNIFYGIITLYLIFFILFLCYYFGIYGKKNDNLSFNKTTIEAVKYVENNEKFDNKMINIRTNVAQPYIYTLIANKTSPTEFNESLFIEGGVMIYDRYIFFDVSIKENIVYVIEKDEGFRKKLLQEGFKQEKFNDTIFILYKE